MGQLTNQYVSQSYQGLLKLDDSATGVTSTLQYVQDGLGNNLPIQVSTSSVSITGSFFGDGSGLTGVTAVVDSGSLVTTSSFNAYTSSNDSKVDALINATGSYATTGSNIFQGNQIITGSLRSTGEIRTDGNVVVGNALLTNNIVNPGTSGDITINPSGFFKVVIDGDTEVTGTLKVTGGITGSLEGTASYATQALSASYAPSNPLPAGIVSGSQQIVDLGFATTSSVNSLSQSIAVTDLAQNGRLTSLETATGSYATTGSNVFVGLQQINNDVVIQGNLYVSGSEVIVSSSTLIIGDREIELNANRTIGNSGIIVYDVVTPEGTGSFQYDVTNNYWIAGQYGSEQRIITSDMTGSMTVLSSSFAENSNTASFAENANTASFALNGGVTQLLAGPNITVSPLSGKGQVTISSLGTGTGSFNTATGSYGSFYDTTTQINPVANTPNSMSFNETAITNGVAISGSVSPFNTYIKTENAGVYNIQFSAQVDKTDSGSDDIDIWIRKNGIDLLDTGTKLTLPSNNGKVVAAWNWFVQSAANDYYQLIWASADTSMRLFAEPSSSAHPGIPSVIATANRVDQFLSNTGSFNGDFNGSFTGSLEGTASFATNALSASFAPMPDVSGFATTGSNTFTGQQNIETNLNVTQSLIVGGNSTFEQQTIYNGNIEYNADSFIRSGSQMNFNIGDGQDGAYYRLSRKVGGEFGIVQDPGNYHLLDISSSFATFLPPTTFTNGATGSFYGDGSGLTGVTAAPPDNMATTGSNTFIGNQEITGSIRVDGDLILDDDGGNTVILLNSKLATEFTGYQLTWSEPTNTVRVDAGERQVNLLYYGFDTTGGTYDNGYHVDVDSNGTTFSDYQIPSYTKVPWLKVKGDNGVSAPQFQRGLGITGSLYVSGSGANDATVEGRMLVFSTSGAGNSAQIQVSGSYLGGGITTVLAGTVTAQSGSLNGIVSKTALTHVDSTGAPTTNKYIGFSANPSLIGAPSVTGVTVPSILAMNGSAQPEAIINFQHRGGYTDGTMTVLKPTDFKSNVNITGSLLMSGSADYDVDVTGRIRITGPSTGNTPRLLVSSSVNNTIVASNFVQVRQPSDNTIAINNGFGGFVAINKETDFTEVGLAVDGAAFAFNWSKGPILYVNNDPADSYDAVFGFQDKTNYTDGRVTVLKPMEFDAGVTGSFNVTGSTTFSGNGGFPLSVDGTISSKRLHFDKNPFNNDPSSNLGAIRLDGFNQTFYFTNYDLADFANKQSVVGLFVNTGSNTANTYLHSLYNGTTAKAELMNLSGSRTFRVDVDSSAFTGSLTVSGGITGSLEGTASFATTASFALNGGGGGSAFPYVGTAIITGSLDITGSAGLSINATNGIVTQYFGNSFGGNIGINKNSDFTEIGLALDGAAWTTNWSTGPLLYVNNTPGDTYEGVFGFQDKTNFTDGRITALKPMVLISGATITGSVQGNVNVLSISSNTASLNLNDGNFFTLQLVEGTDTRIEPSNIKAGQTVNIKLNTTGSATVSFPSSVKQASGSAYVPTTTTGTDIITMVSFDGSDLYLANVKNLI